MKLTEKQYNERRDALLTISQDISPGDSGHIDAHKALVDYMQLQPLIRSTELYKNEADTWHYMGGGETVTLTDSDVDELLDSPDEPGVLITYGDSSFGGDLFPTSAASCPAGSWFVIYFRGTHALSQIAEAARNVVPLYHKIYSLEEAIDQLQSDIEALKNPE